MEAAKDMPQGDAKLTGLRLFLWDNEVAAKHHVVPSDEGLFIFDVVLKQRNKDEDKKTTAVHNFKFLPENFPDDVISKSNLFSPKNAGSLSRQASDYIQSCFRFWNCENIMHCRARFVVLADILVDDHQGLRTGISDKGSESHSQTDHGFEDDDNDCSDHASNGHVGELGGITMSMDAGNMYLMNQLFGTLARTANALFMPDIEAGDDNVLDQDQEDHSDDEESDDDDYDYADDDDIDIDSLLVGPEDDHAHADVADEHNNLYHTLGTNFAYNFQPVHAVTIQPVHDVTDAIKSTDLEDPQDVHNQEELNHVLGILRSAAKKRQHDDPAEASRPAKHIKLAYEEDNESHEHSGLCKVKQTLQFLQGGEKMVEKHQGHEDEVSEDLCSICLEKLQRDVEIVRLVRCKHTFHRQCLFKWLPKKQSCPCCRTSSLANVYFTS